MCAQQVRVTENGEYIIVSEQRKEQRRKKTFETRLLRRRDDLRYLRHRHKKEEKSRSGYNFTPQISITDLESQGVIKRSHVRHSAKARQVRAQSQDEMGPRMLTALSSLARVVQEKESAQYGKWNQASLPGILSTRPVLVSTDWSRLCDVPKPKDSTKNNTDKDSGHGSDACESRESCRSETPPPAMRPDKPLQFRTTLPPLRVQSIKNETFASLVNAGDLRGLKELLRMRRDEGRLKETDINNALFLAVSRDRPDMADILLRSGGDPSFGSLSSKIDLHLQSTPVILQAVITNCAKSVKLLLDFGANPNVNIKQTPLHFACRRGNLNIVKMLVRAGAVTHAQSMEQMTPLMMASSYGEYKCVRYLLIQSTEDINWRDQEGGTALHYAAKIGSVNVIRTLLAHGANEMAVDGSNRTPLIVAMQGRHTAAADLLLPLEIEKRSNVLSRTMLCHAVICKHVPSVELLIEKGASVNTIDANSRPPLYYAIVKSCAELVKKLVPLTNIKDTWVDPYSCFNMYANTSSKFDDEDIDALKTLMDVGVDINTPNQPHVAIVQCAWQNDAEKVKTLLNIGAQPDITNHLGNTALNGAVKHDNIKLINLLLTENFDVGVTDNIELKYDPLDRAMDHENLPMIRLLVSMGCSIHNMKEWPSMAGILPKQPPSSSERDQNDVTDDIDEDITSDVSSINDSDASNASISDSDKSDDNNLLEDNDWLLNVPEPFEMLQVELHTYLMKYVKYILMNKFDKPRPLQEICKLSVKRTLGHNDVEKKIQSLPLPNYLLSYLDSGYTDAVFNTKHFNFWMDVYENK